MSFIRRLTRRVRPAHIVLFAIMAIVLAASHPASIFNGFDSSPISPALAQDAALANRSAPVRAFSDPTWHKRWWIEKTARLLRGGDGIGSNDDIGALLKLSDEEIARRFMTDIRFGDSILDFNMYYLGFKIDTLKLDGVYKRNAFDFSNAVAATQELLNGGDYLKLFDLEGPFFMPPLPTVPDDPPAPEDAGLSLDRLRIKAIDEVEGIFIDLFEFGPLEVRRSAKAYCNEFEKVIEGAAAVHGKFNRAFNDEDVFIVMMRGHVVIDPLEILARAHQAECVDKPAARADVKRLSAAAKEALDRYTRAVHEILKFEPAIYRPRSVLEFKPLDLSAFKMDKWLALGFEQSSSLKNSSTNFNRRRGAYVLKRFFCDDLTPVGFESPQQHVTGVHGSDTPCFACHFKLDPIAGFFRDRGTYFYDYANNDNVVFDDGVPMNRKKYEAAWRAPKGSAREWNVGYIRSPRFEENNSYGQSVADLSRIIRNAPEARRCLMKRLFEYLVAEEQTIDGGYLDELTRKFEEEAVQNSSSAMKNAIVRIVLSNTYNQADPDPRQCYDRAPGAKVEDAPPCRVASILQKNCVQCHGGPEGFAGLDLSSWILAPDGATRTFPHLDRGRKQVAPHDTMTRITERLSSTDPAVRMPKERSMSDQERQELFLWAQEELARRTKSDRR